MKYYVLHVSQIGEQPLAKEVFDFDTLEAAKANHYYFLSSSYSNPNLNYFLSEILYYTGSVIEKEIYTKEVQ